MMTADYFHVRQTDEGFDVVHATMGKIASLDEYMDCVEFIGDWAHLSDEERGIILLTDKAE